MSPTSEAIKAAAAGADWAHAPGFYVILTDEPGAKSWPIAGATFILIQKQPKDAAAASEALKFFAWAYKNGGKMAESLDYVPMPDSVVKLIEANVEERRQGRRRQADLLIRATMGKGAVTAPFPCPPPLTRRLVVRPRGRLSGAPGRAEPRESRMQPAGRRAVVDVALQGGAMSAPSRSIARKVLQRLRLSDAVFRHLTRAAAIAVLVILGGVIVSLVHGSLAGAAHVRLRLSWSTRAGTRSPRSSARSRRSTARSSPRSSPC